MDIRKIPSIPLSVILKHQWSNAVHKAQGRLHRLHESFEGRVKDASLWLADRKISQDERMAVHVAQRAIERALDKLDAPEKYLLGIKLREQVTPAQKKVYLQTAALTLGICREFVRLDPVKYKGMQAFHDALQDNLEKMPQGKAAQRYAALCAPFPILTLKFTGFMISHQIMTGMREGDEWRGPGMGGL